MVPKHIRQFILLATLGIAPALGMSDAMAGAEQAADAQKQTGDAKDNTGTAKDKNTGATGQARKNAAGKAPETVLMLVPVIVASKDNSMKSGCWARIYSETNYSGDTMTLSGPLSIADMSGPFGLDWDDKVDSVEVGPKATLTVFDNEQFRDQVALFKASQKVPDVSKKLGFFDEFGSVRLSCAKT